MTAGCRQHERWWPRHAEARHAGRAKRKAVHSSSWWTMAPDLQFCHDNSEFSPGCTHRAVQHRSVPTAGVHSLSPVCAHRGFGVRCPTALAFRCRQKRRVTGGSRWSGRSLSVALSVPAAIENMCTNREAMRQWRWSTNDGRVPPCGRIRRLPSIANRHRIWQPNNPFSAACCCPRMLSPT